LPLPQPDAVFDRVATHGFHPLDGTGERTIDRDLGHQGIADLDDRDWLVRTLAVRDLVRAGIDDPAAVRSGLEHPDPQARYVSAMALGILGDGGATEALEQLLADDRLPIVRSQAAIALGQSESVSSLPTLAESRQTDESRDVRHQCELAIDQITKHKGTTERHRSAWVALDDSSFGRPTAGSQAPDFELRDTNGQPWALNDRQGRGWTVLIWVFADWCPVCHGEFRELMELRADFEQRGIRVATLECHDTYRGRVMVGHELEPDYWFAERSFRAAYTEEVWWPHLLDHAGAVGARYGVDPLAFAVHSEYINRPATVVIDPEGVIRFSYIGTYWGDRPSVEETLHLMATEQFAFEHPNRLRAANTSHE
jgi:peroxiredoxin